MASSSASASGSTPCDSSESHLKRKSNDVGWDYGILADPSNLDRVKCIRCGKIMSGGVRRLKDHIAKIQGNVLPCPTASSEDQAKCRNAINEAKAKKTRMRQREDALISSVNIMGPDIESLEEDELRSLGSKHSRSLGPMDKFASSINPEASLAKTTREQNIHDALWKERSNLVKYYLADWVYEAGISFNALILSV